MKEKTLLIISIAAMTLGVCLAFFSVVLFSFLPIESQSELYINLFAVGVILAFCGIVFGMESIIEEET